MAVGEAIPAYAVPGPGEVSMARTHCLTHDELAAFNLGKLPPGMVDELAAHLEGCPRCEAAARDLDGLSDPLDPGTANEKSWKADFRRFTQPVLVVVQAWRGRPVYVHLNGRANTWLK